MKIKTRLGWKRLNFIFSFLIHNMIVIVVLLIFIILLVISSVAYFMMSEKEEEEEEEEEVQEVEEVKVFTIPTTTPIPEKPILLYGVGTDNKLYGKTNIEGTWVLLDGSEIKSVCAMMDGSLAAVGMNGRVYTKKTVKDPWVIIGVGSTDNRSCCIQNMTQLYDGSMIAIGVDGYTHGKRWKKDKLEFGVNAGWDPTTDTWWYRTIIQLRDSSFLCIAGNNELFYRPSLDPSSPPWKRIDQGSGVIDITQMPDGTILGVGTDHNLYFRNDLTGPWKFLGMNNCCVKQISAVFPVNTRTIKPNATTWHPAIAVTSIPEKL